jgi:hypothetical protein
MKYNLTPVRIAIIRKTKNKTKQNAGEDEEKHQLLHTAGGNVNYYYNYEKWSFLRKLKIKLPLRSISPTTTYISKEKELSVLRRVLPSHVYYSKKCTQSICLSTDESIKKMQYVYSTIKTMQCHHLWRRTLC